MSSTPARTSRCGLDTVDLSRVEALLRGRTPAELAEFFTPQELADAGTGPGRTASLAGRFAAKEACAKLFPRETALGLIEPADFHVLRDRYGQPRVEVNARARAVLDRHRLASVQVSITHTQTSASAVVTAEPRVTDVPWFGRWLYHLLPYRRGIVLENLRRVFGETLPDGEITLLAQAYYAHYVRFLAEIVRLPFMTTRRRKSWVRVENLDVALRAHAQGRGMFLLTGHLGNFEISTVAGITQFPQYRGKFHFVRRPLKPRLLNALVNWRFHRAGFGTLSKRGSLEAIFDVLRGGGVVVYVLDQHAGRRDAVVVDFFGHPAGTFKSLAILALDTGAPVVPVTSWREPDGSHVIRFEEPIPSIECADVGEAIRRNTRAYNEALERFVLRHPEQWIWMHRRWKVAAGGGHQPSSGR